MKEIITNPIRIFICSKCKTTFISDEYRVEDSINLFIQCPTCEYHVAAGMYDAPLYP
jgi:DNA-directed RNA polymerase subunit RPC12/RpoP